MNYVQELAQAIMTGDAARAAVACRSSYDFGDYIIPGDSKSMIWLGRAAEKGSVAVVNTLLDAGFNINALRLPEKSTALDTAIGFDHDEVVELLLDRGADPNLGRPLISAINEGKTPERRLKYVKLLVEHGADINRLYDLYGDSNNQFAALDWTSDPAVIAYLRQHGAKTATEIKAGKEPVPPTAMAGKKQLAPVDEVIRYFGDNVGPVDKRALIEIVPTGHPIAIHAIRPDGKRKHLTLFTAGLSEKPMTTPPGQSEYTFAELFIELPGDWPCGPSCPPEKAWLTHWLRKIAQYPHDNHTWLGGPLTIIDNEDPPQKLGPNVKFTSWLLLAEKSFKRGDGQPIQLYRVMPLYPDERDLERREGAPALMRAFDRNSVPFIVDLNRKSVAKSDR